MGPISFSAGRAHDGHCLARLSAHQVRALGACDGSGSCRGCDVLAPQQVCENCVGWYWNASAGVAACAPCAEQDHCREHAAACASAYPSMRQCLKADFGLLRSMPSTFHAVPRRGSMGIGRQRAASLGDIRVTREPELEWPWLSGTMYQAWIAGHLTHSARAPARQARFLPGRNLVCVCFPNPNWIHQRPWLAPGEEGRAGHRLRESTVVAPLYGIVIYVRILGARVQSAEVSAGCSVAVAKLFPRCQVLLTAHGEPTPESAGTR